MTDFSAIVKICKAAESRHAAYTTVLSMVDKEAKGAGGYHEDAMEAMHSVLDLVDRLMDAEMLDRSIPS